MRSRLITTTLAGVAAGLVVLLAPGQALADTAQTASGFEQRSNGGGRAAIETTATAQGAAIIDTSAVGGNGLLGLFGGPTSARGSAGVEQFVQVEAGEYEVSVVITGAEGTESAQGNGSATVLAALSAGYTEANEVVTAGGDSAELSSNPSTVALSFTAEFDEATSLRVSAYVYAESKASGSRNQASANASTSTITISVERIG